MKKYISLFLAAGALALTGCVEGSLPKEDGNEITIQAVMAENPGTRTMIQDGTTSVLWEPGDEVKLFYKTTGSRFTSNNTEPSGTADFTGNLTITGFFGEGFTADTPLWAVYPYRADATSDGESVTTTLPAEQTGRASSFAKSTNITLAKSSNTKMGFYNVCGGVRFSLTQEGVKEVVFQGQNDESIAGKVKLTFVDGVPAIQEVTEGQKTITLTAPNNGTFETGKWYYIVALPGTLSNGFKMTFNTETQYATLKSSGSKTIKRGVFGSLTDADEDLIYKDKGTEEPPTGNIVFADLAAKYACVAKFDTNGDGEVSVEEAEAATSFSGLFNDWKGVESFDEISYFKNVHSLNGVFNGCNKLVSITVPENITDLGTYAFSGCTLLTSVVLPSGITTIGNYTFQNCSSLAAIDIPSTVTSIGQYAFSGCTALTSVELPSGVTSISDYTFSNCSRLSSVGIPSGVTSVGSYAFNSCSSLGSIDLPSNLKIIGQYAFANSGLTQITIPDEVTSLGTYAFSGCSNLTIANLPSGITSIPAYCFNKCGSLTSTSIPDGVTVVGDKAFYAVNMWKLELPSNVSSLGSECFAGIVCVILSSTTPVMIKNNTFSSVKGIFVPSNMIDMYSVMTIWTNYASKLYPINSYKEKGEFTLVANGAVDMGTSVKWAAFNIGATKPEEYGNYYAWGETDTKEVYYWNTYKWCMGGIDYMTKYCNDSSHGYNGFTDNKLVLDPEDDAAIVILGDNWRIPTDEEWTELQEHCLFEWASYEGTSGYKVFAIGGDNMLFLPAAGYRSGSSLKDDGSSGGYYWSSSLFTRHAGHAWYLFFDSNSCYHNCGYRAWGYSIRPVCD